MRKFKNKKELIEASDNDITSFFKEAKFAGKFDTSISDEQKEKYCGQVTDITMDGAWNNICPKFIYVPIKYAKIIREGSCEFKCYIILKLLREKNACILQISSINNLNSINFKAPIVKSFDLSEESTFKRNLKLKDNLFIGQFTQNRDGSYTIRDIRRSDFSKLILQNGKEQLPIGYHPKGKKIQNGKYYEFSWVLNAAKKDEYLYLFKVDESKPFKEISSRELINRLHNDIMGYPAGAGQKIVKMLDTLKNQLTASGKEIFIYELLQNANDYPYKENGITEKVNIEFHITQKSLLFMHSGSDFNEKNIAAICSINDKEKTDNKDAIGYKGIGFKTVFLDNNYVYLQTNDFSFRFDKEETKDIVDTPWQILPIWTNYKTLAQAEKDVFNNVDKKFRVKFALHPTNINILRGEGQNYIKMFKNVFQNERVILFIPNLDSVKVFYNENSIPDIICNSNNDRWQVNDYIDIVPEEVTQSINADIDKQEDSGTLKIPTKYYDFTKTKVSFACEVEGSQLKEVEDTQLYCYLPTKATWGFNFLMNTDMIPTGPRDDIEIDFADQININLEIAKIAGRQFFEWIKSLCELKKYKYSSIFRLIPVFETNIREHGKYKRLIEKFKEGFDNRLNNEEFIPVDASTYKVLSRIILDETGLTSSGIINDEDFFRLSGLDGYLPIAVLRKDREFNAFLKRYLKEFNSSDNIWTKEDLKALCKETDFKEWLEDQNNNNKFLNFLLERRYLEEFIDEEIFLEEEGALYTAAELYYNIDKYLIDIFAFSNHVCYLSAKTREYFIGNEKWNSIIADAFKEFNCDDFVDDVLLSNENYSETIKKLNDKKISIHFFKFLAENIGFSERYFSLPFINDKDELVTNFEKKVIFFSSEIGNKVCEYDWISGVRIEFLSKDYLDVSKEYFKGNFYIKNFSDEIIIKDIILSEEYHDIIENSINEDFETSKAFIDYCYEFKEFLWDGSLRKYALHVYDCQGDEQWCLTEDNIYFQSDLYENYSSKEWIDSSWMYVLDEDYFNISNNDIDLKHFLSNVFGIEELTKANFYTSVVKCNLKAIFNNTRGNNDADGSKNFDFINYLDDSYRLIFEEEKDGDLFDRLILVSEEGSDVEHKENKLYIFDEELEEIVGYDWFPKDIIHICNKEYGKSKALSAIGVKNFKFSEFYDDVILSEISSINDNIKDKEVSIAFHKFIIDRMSGLTADQQSKMIHAKVFLLGHDEAENSAAGHKILNVKAKELFDLGLVEFSDLDIIDPDYKTEDNSEYWEMRLGNTKFSVSDFYNWLKNNIDDFSITLKSEESNINFWRWVKDNISDAAIEKLPVLPLLIDNDELVESDGVIYLSDSYIENGSIETIVKKYHDDALFISEKYIAENDNVGEWKEFWTKIGLLSEVADILINTIIPKLDEIYDEKLLATIAIHQSRLEEVYDNLPSKLSKLRVKALDGKFYSVSEAIYVNTEKLEPFTFIELPNQIRFETASERMLIKSIIESVDGQLIDSLTDWQLAKIKRYLDIQKEDKKDEEFLSIHYKLINELSALYEYDKEKLNTYGDIKEIKLLDKSNKLCNSSDLTMGTIYNPFCDFEKYKIDDLDYLSDSYKKECSNDVRKLFNNIYNVHCNFKKTDIAYLENREFSIYFWCTYLNQRTADKRGIKDLIETNELDKIACIPTQNKMMAPTQIYSRGISSYVKNTENWEDKLPLTSLPEIEFEKDKTFFDILPFNKSLKFIDSLNALFKIQGKDKRQTLLQWMIESHNDKFTSSIESYRSDKNALWKNVKNQNSHISELYALEYGDKMLGQYFGNLPKIINKDYLPTGPIPFRSACDILKIATIKSNDLIVEPINPVNRDQYVKTDLYLYTLVIAGYENEDDWEDIYKKYSSKIEEIKFICCDAISLRYREDASICQCMKKFYTEKGTSDFYYVKSIDDKLVYIPFVESFTEYLSITSEDDFIKTIMASREIALDYAKENNALMLDEKFKEELNKLIPGIKHELNGQEANDMDILDERKRHKNIIDENLTCESDCEIEDTNEEIGDDWIDNNIDDDNNYSEDENYEDIKTSTNNRKSTDDNRSNSRPNAAYPEMKGWNDNYKKTPTVPKPFSPDDVRNFGSNCITRTLEVLEPTASEVNEINRILGEELTSTQIADLNYLAQLRLFNNLKTKGMEPDESVDDFVRNAHLENEHTINGGKYIHKCSAVGGIMYLSPSIWNKIADDSCVVCVYLGPKSNEFMYFNNINDILQWVGEDDIVIKLTGEEKVEVVEELYSTILHGVKGTAYTMIRINSNEKYNSIFAPLSNDYINAEEVDINEY
ncbi:MAG: sacsin N-terminal ATP-binding-like domain-containing protein [Bacteroidales bacterium]